MSADGGEVDLRPLDRGDWQECVRLRLAPEQERFVSTNVYSLAESRFNPSMVPLAVCRGETMVGFVMYGRDPDDGNLWIYRLMID